MITTVGALRRLVREFGLDATMRNQAGFGDTSGASSNVTDREAILSPPPALGDPEAQEEKSEHEEEGWEARRRQRRTGWRGRED